MSALVAALPATSAWMPAHHLSSQALRPAKLLSSSLSSSSTFTVASPNACLLSRSCGTKRALTRLYVSAVDAEADDAHHRDLAQPSQQQQEQPQQPGQDGSLNLSNTQKIINAVFLAVSFGYALYEVLNIDHGMTRGWTASEIAMRIPLDNWENYESSLANKPVFTKTLINVIIYLLGDWLSQTVFQKKNVLEFDIQRTLRNGFIGLCFGPLVHEYYQFSDTILPPEDGMVTRLEKILMDQTIYLTVKCSIYISAVGLLSGESWPTVQQKVKDKIVPICFTAWKFWPLVHCITYGLIPARHRILWVNSVDLVWNAILATQANKPKQEPDQDAALPGAENALLLQNAAAQDNDALTSNESSISPLVVLDNQWVEDQKDHVAEILGANNNNQNMTADAVAA